MPNLIQELMQSRVLGAPGHVPGAIPQEEADDYRLRAQMFADGAMERLADAGIYGDPSMGYYRSKLDKLRADSMGNLAWSNPQQAAAAMQAFVVDGYDGLRALGYELPTAHDIPSAEDSVDGLGGSRHAMSRHLVPPEAMKALQAIRDVDLIRSIYKDDGELASPAELQRALAYHQSSLNNPFTHRDYGSPNYRSFAGDSALDASKAIGHFIADPENPVAGALLTMDAGTNTVLGAMANDTELPDEDTLGRLVRGADRTGAMWKARDRYRQTPSPILDMANSAGAEDKAARISELRSFLEANQPVDSRESLHNAGVDPRINTPMVGSLGDVASSALDPSLFNPLAQAALAGPNAATSLAVDVGTDAAINTGMNIAAAPKERTWAEYASQPYQPPSKERAAELATQRTLASGDSSVGLGEYRRRAQELSAPSMTSPGMQTPGGMTPPIYDRSREDRLRRVKALVDMYNSPFTGR